MVQVSYPGVYVQEVPSGSRTITGVATSIALFIGMARRGPINVPVQILNFSDYQRTFSDDVSAGELTDQVRQFFLNGGRRAYVVRVADGATQATLGLGSDGGSEPGILLTSRGFGEGENSLRASVDFNTDNPGVSFNLSLYRETFDSAGNASVSDQEVHRNLSFILGQPRYIETVIARDSSLVSAAVSSALTAGEGVSRSGRISDGLAAAITAAIGTRPDGRFSVTISGVGTRTVLIAHGALTTESAIQALIQGQFEEIVATDITVNFVSLDGDDEFLEVRVAGRDVILGSASQNDIAAELGLGVLNGGDEQGAFYAFRPVPGGILLPHDLESLATTNRSAVAGGTIQLTGPEGFSIPGSSVEFPTGASGSFLLGTRSGKHLANARENLTAIVSAINRGQSRWRASLQGFQIALRPSFGSAATGEGAIFTVPGLLSAPVIGRAAATSFDPALSGTVAGVQEYLGAFQIVDQQVDLFNLVVLPKSSADTGTPSIRSQVWGAASSFCHQRRALLILDAEEGVTDTAAAVAEVQRLRIGLKKDHAALYWPRVAINPDGTRRFVDPSGSIAGLMSRIDATRGVWKAPAGIEAELLGTLGIEVAVSDAENGVLNPDAVNTLRLFPNGIVSWGARTMDGFDNSGNDDYKYVPVRRLALYIAESLQRGLKFAVFEPNDEPLWAQLRLAAGGFMNNLFRRGAFQGSTARESYFVKVDNETTTQNDINLGIVNVVIGFAPLKPAEFVVVTLKQQAGQIQV